MRGAFGYCRVSSAGQSADDRDGIPRQKQKIKEWATANGYRIVQWFVDTVTGKSDLDHRPALQDMLTALHSDGVKVIVIEKLDRLARDLMVQEAIIADLQRDGFTIISAMEADLFGDDPTRKLLRQMLGAFSEYERSMIVLKLRGARQRAKAKDPSRHEGRKQFGHRSGETETIARVIELDAAGLKLPAICAQLNQEQRPTRAGGIWFPQQVSRILNRAKKTG